MDLKGVDDIYQYDDVLFSILKDCGNLPNFLDIVFGFLNRRTDLYLVAKEQNSPVGLPEGYAEKFVKAAFFKWKSEGYSKCADPVKDNYEARSPPADDVEIEIITDTNETLVTDEKEYFTPSDYYNGSKFENYAWSQTINELCVIIKVPENVTTKMLNVKLTPLALSVTLKSGGVLLQGDLRHKCKHSELIWSLTATKLDIQLEKASEVWWDSLISTEPKLDVQKIDCSRPFEDLSESAQAKIEELQWNQERKRLGLPTSDDLAQDNMRNIFNSQILGSTNP